MDGNNDHLRQQSVSPGATVESHRRGHAVLKDGDGPGPMRPPIRCNRLRQQERAGLSRPSPVESVLSLSYEAADALIPWKLKFSTPQALLLPLFRLSPV